MAIVNGSLQEGYKDAAWFAANPTLVLLVGQKVNLEQTGTYKLGDGTTQLSALSFLGGSGSGLSGLTTNKVLKATSSTTAGDSLISDDGTIVTIDTEHIKAGDSTYNTIYIGKNSGLLADGSLGAINNVSMGVNSMQNLTIGHSNVAIGSNSLQSVTEGSGCVAIGMEALNGITDYSTYGTIGIGENALKSVNAGLGNVAIGYTSQQGTTAGGNTSVGFQSLQANSTGNTNAAFGQNAIFLNTTGSGNSGFGNYAMANMVSGSQNVSVGNYSLPSCVSGSNNVSLGSNAGYSNTGSGSIFIGYAAGYNETGSNKLYIDNSTTTTPLLGGDFSTNSLTKRGVEIATVNDIPTVDTTIIDGSTNAVSGNAVFDGLATKAGNLIAKINTAIAHTGTTSETILNSSTPISGFEANDFIKFQGNFMATNNANIKAFRIYVNTSHSLVGATQIALYNIAGSAQNGAPFVRNLWFKNSLTAQGVYSTTNSLNNDELAVGASADTALTYDFSGTNYLIISCTLANAADTFTIKWFKAQRQR